MFERNPMTSSIAPFHVADPAKADQSLCGISGLVLILNAERAPVLVGGYGLKLCAACEEQMPAIIEVSA